MNPLQHLYDQFNTGDPGAKYATLPEFPLMIDVELTSACNFRCNFCPTGLGLVTRPAGLMSSTTWQKMVDECAPYGTALRMIGWGEPLLHPNVVSFINYASEKGLLTHLNTNASKLTPRLAEALVDAGLSSIKFSFQGIDRASYSEARQADFFDGMLTAIGWMSLARGHRKLPYIAASTSTTSETPEQIEAFRERMEPMVDYLSVGRTVFDFLDGHAGRLRPRQRELFDKARAHDSAPKVHPDPCPEVYSKLSIAWTGEARVCCNDWDGETNLGKIGETPISEIWRDKVIESYRERLARKKYTGPLCSVCFDYQSLTEGAS